MNCTSAFSLDHSAVAARVAGMIDNLDATAQTPVRDALRIAEREHKGRLRGGSTLPEIIHPMRVALKVAALGLGNSDVLCAALLHDVLEDGPAARDDRQGIENEIAAACSTRCLQIVQLLTRREGEDRPAGGIDALHHPYLERLYQADPALRDEALLIKLADKTDNLLDARHLPPEKKARKVPLYLREALVTYLPLTEMVSDLRLRDDLAKALLSALSMHPAAMIGPIVEEVVTLCPRLPRWVGWDGACLTPGPGEPAAHATALARHLAEIISTSIDEPQTATTPLGRLLERCGLPPALLPSGAPKERKLRRELWQRVLHELEALESLLTSAEPPAWLTPLTASGESELLLLIPISLLFRPASWAFEQWHADSGAALSAQCRSIFSSLGASDAVQQHWRAVLQLLLVNRNAVWRWHTSRAPFLRVRELASSALPGTPPVVQWSARLLAEYLNLIGACRFHPALACDPAELPGAFASLWRKVESAPFLSSFPDAAGLPCDSKETHLFFETRELYRKHGLESIFAGVVQALLALTASEPAWIAFDLEELSKRLPEIQKSPPLAARTGETPLQALARLGHRPQISSIGGVRLIRVLPSLLHALKNRLPEVSGKDGIVFAETDCTATAIFDRLLLASHRVGADLTADGLSLCDGQPVPPLWLPRIYRVLDTAADLDPGHVQSLTIRFTGADNPPVLPAWLPLPRETETDAAQQRRKEFVAAYLARQIYNFAVIRRVGSAVVEVAPHPHPGAFSSDDELRDLIQQIESRQNLRSVYGRFCENFNFDPFRIASSSSIPGEEALAPFTASDMQADITALGIDIGGTDVKLAIFRGGRHVTQYGLGKFSTPKIRRRARHLKCFCARLIKGISAWLGADHGQVWQSIDAIGISWAGAVRSQRIVGLSGLLQRLRKPSDGQPFDASASANDVQGLDFLDGFRQALSTMLIPVKPALALAIENDGSADALGNYAAAVMSDPQLAKNTIVIKLGTSLAGGRISRDGSVADDVGEYSKALLTLNAPTPPSGQVTGAVRDYVSSIAVRRLSRTVRGPDGPPVFAAHGAWNVEENKEQRIESKELGLLMSLVPEVTRTAFMRHLTVVANQPDAASWQQAIQETQAVLGQEGEDIPAPLLAVTGRDWIERSPAVKGLSPSEAGQHRLCLLAQGQLSSAGTADTAALAEKAVASCLIFSQLALQAAHTIALLYNIYGRGAFDQVIFSGGVLGGDTGPHVLRQIRAFMENQYDKLCGTGTQPLRPDAITTATAHGDLAGPLGAAMSANRLHKQEALAAMRRRIASHLAACSEGTPVSVQELTASLAAGRVTAEHVAAHLRSLAATGYLLPAAASANEVFFVLR